MSSARYIVILGPDGCGKTTLADRLNSKLLPDYQMQRSNFSFGQLPSLSRILGRREKIAPIAGEPNSGMSKPLNLPHALILSLWYGLDHVLGHLTLKRAGRNKVFIFARSYHDFLYQRAYLEVPKFVPRIFLALGPKPLAILLPLRDPKKIHKEKPELTCEEIMRQYQRIIESLRGCSVFQTVDSAGGIDEMVRNADTILKGLLRNR